MKKLSFAFIYLLINMVLLSDCKSHSTKSSSANEPISSERPATDNIGLNPSIVYDNFLIGGLILAQIMTTPPNFDYMSGAQHHYDYDLCTHNDHKCQSGKFFWGPKIFPTLVQGDYDVTVKPCGAPVIEEEICGDESSLSFNQANNPNNDLMSLIQQEVQITKDIKAQAGNLYDAYNDYKSSIFPQGPAPADTISQSVQTQLIYGKDLIAELINSSTYVSYFKDYYSGTTVTDVQTTTSVQTTQLTTTVQTTVTQTSTSTDTQEQIQSLQNQITQLSNQVAKNKNNSGPANAAGSLFIALGSIAFVSGAVLATFSWYVPRYLNSGKVENKINDLVDKASIKLQKEMGAKIDEAHKKFEESRLVESADQAMNKYVDVFFKDLHVNIDNVLKNEVIPELLKVLIRSDEMDLSPLLEPVISKKEKVKAKVKTEIANLNIDPMLEAAIAEARQLVLGPFKLNVAVDENFLKKMFGGAEKLNQKFEIVEDGNRNKLYYDRPIDPASKKLIYYVDSQKNVYKVGSNLQKISDSELKEELRGQSNYVEIDGKFYIKTAVLYAPLIPQLSPETLANLEKNRQRLQDLKMSGQKKYADIDIDKEFAKGVPLIDIHERLVRPPGDWRVDGVNWPNSEGVIAWDKMFVYENVDAGKFHGKKGAELNNDNIFYNTEAYKDATGQKILIFDVSTSRNTAWELDIKAQMFAQELRVKKEELRAKGLGKVDAGAEWVHREIFNFIQENRDLIAEFLYNKIHTDLPQHLDPLLERLKEEMPDAVKMKLQKAIVPKIAELLEVKMQSASGENKEKEIRIFQEIRDLLNQKLKEEYLPLVAEKIQSHIEHTATSVKEEYVPKAIDAVKMEVDPIARTGKIASVILLTVGASAIAGGFVQQSLGLSLQPIQDLQTKLQKIENDVMTLQIQRLKVLDQIHSLLTKNGYKIPNGMWVYNLTSSL